MGVHLTKDSIDLGIVVRDPEKSLAFYRDTLGFTDDGVLAMPGGSTMYRLYCGSSLIKLVHHAKADELPSPEPGGLNTALGYRYWTISVDNLQEVADACARAGYKLAIKPVEFRPGVTITMIEDPDGNWVELVSR